MHQIAFVQPTLWSSVLCIPQSECSGSRGSMSNPCALKGHQSKACAVQVYAGPLHGGSRAVVLFNRHAIGTQYPISNITVTWRQLGFGSDVKAIVRDLHAEKDLGTFTKSFTGEVDIHDARMLKVTPHHVKPQYDTWRPWAAEEDAELRSILLQHNTSALSSRQHLVSS